MSARGSTGSRADLRASIMGFSLRDGISFCRVGDRTIFLDILADRYFCLSQAAERSFMDLVESGAQQEDEHLRGLVARGLLIPSSSSAAPHPGGPVRVPQASMLDLSLPPPGFTGTISALSCLAAARLRLKMAGFGRTLSWLSARKARLPRSRAIPDGQADRIAAGFASAARFSSQFDNCLAHSIAMASHMIAKGLLPQVVLGVQLGPFSAHCWVQYGDRLVNDRFDMVRTFTPILVI
ncbi:lasso peptide biosynthesis B2 protein [Sphingobium sp. Cam5-1]|uniref:lasso peptide biosynthesis B2 protein n=1 Tax=Sphingobium sp. Cam5-1 TaxID=2789327 RepID=UPI0018AD1FC0|nr:lasso peptide biosynthesis B2 protein [Sphingobium sp. Cam5-1]QPI72228.1 lasso peptide biosynthesis B2 protein [Sphingobium sp. Cam5-1]